MQYIALTCEHNAEFLYCFQTAALRREVELRMKASVGEGQTVSAEVG